MGRHPGAKRRCFLTGACGTATSRRAVQKMPQRGDISARSALTIHRGTANRSNEARPVLVVGVDAPDATNANHHDLQVTRAYVDSCRHAFATI